MNKKIYFLIVIGMTLISVLWLNGCSDKNRKAGSAKVDLSSTQLPGYQVWDMKVLKTEVEEITSRMYAGYVKGASDDLNQLDGGEIDSGLTMIFYKKGALYGRLDSKRGTMSEDIYVAIDSVVLKSPAGYTLYTDKLTWNKLEKRFFTDTPVMTVKDNDTLRGDGFVSSEDFMEYNLINPRGKAFMSEEKINSIDKKNSQ